MVFSRYLAEENIWSLNLDESGRATGPPVKAFDSAKSEFLPKFSPDGTKVAFESRRSGSSQIWVCLSNGSDCTQLTREPHAGSPDWSPDGKWIVFDVAREGGYELHIMSSDGGKRRLLRRGTGDMPRWSRDGQWIYFRCGQPVPQICRIPVSGGDAHPIIGADGRIADESPDGKWLYYSRRDLLRTPIQRVPSNGGDSKEVIREVAGRNWSVVDTGIWYMTPSTSQGSLLQFYDFRTKSARTIYRTSRPVYAGLSLSPDRGRILFTQVDRAPSRNLMLVENFR